MDIKLQRLHITKEKANCFIGRDHRGRRYKLIKNDYSKKFKIGDDRYIYFSILKKGIFGIVITPMSHEEYLKIAGTVSQ